MDRVREAPTWLKIAVPVVLVGLIAASVPGEHKHSHSSAPAASAPSQTHRLLTPAEHREAAFEANQREAVELKESIKGAISTDDSPIVRCAGQTNCGVTYDIGEIVGIDTEEELLDDQRDVWEAMFADPKFQSGFIELEAKVETVGGKSLTDPVLRVRCNRSAARQIDWSNVRAEGFKQLCKWEELIKF